MFQRCVETTFEPQYLEDFGCIGILKIKIVWRIWNFHFLTGMWRYLYNLYRCSSLMFLHLTKQIQGSQTFKTVCLYLRFA